MNATVLALLNLNFPGWINELNTPSDESFQDFSFLIIQHYRRLGLRRYTEVITYATHHNDCLISATGKPYHAPRM